MGDSNRLTFYSDQTDVLDGPPIYDAMGRLVAVLNREHPLAQEHAAHFVRAPMTIPAARELARKLGHEGFILNWAASIILAFDPAKVPSLKVVTNETSD